MTLTSILAFALLHFLWQGALIQLVLFIALRLFAGHSATTRYLLGVASLLLMALAPAATAWRLSRAPVSAIDASVGSPAGAASTLGNLGNEATADAPSTLQPPATSVTVPLRNAAQALAPLADRVQPALPWLVAAWLTGVLILALRLLGGWLRLRGIVRGGSMPSSALYEPMLQRLRHLLLVSRPVRILESAMVHTPAVIGWMRPVLLVPASLSSGLTVSQLETIIAHELAHIKRHDFAVNLLQSVIEIVLFYHPAVWWVSRHVRQEREHCCDDLAVATAGNARLYASALLELETLRSDGMRLAVAAAGGNLLKRVRRLIAPATMNQGEESRWLAGIVVLLALLLVGGSTRLLQAEPEMASEAPNAALVKETEGLSASDLQAPDTVILYSGAEPLDRRWIWAERTARDNRFAAYWIGYVIESDVSRGWHYLDRHAPVRAEGGTTLLGHMRMTEARGLIFSGDRLDRLIPGPAPSDMTILIGFSERNGRVAIDRVHAGNFAFNVPLAGRPILWLGESSDAPSIRLVEQLLADARSKDLRTDLINVIGLHTTSSLVRPFLERSLADEDNEDVRADVVELLGFHADERTVGLLARVARDDRASRIRAEAAESLSEVELPTAFDTLVALTRSLRDTETRREAIEGLGHRKEPRALEVLKMITESDPSSEMQKAAVETIGELKTERAIVLLTELARSHDNAQVRREAVETLGEHAPLEEALRQLRRIVDEDRSVDVQREAVETLAEREDRRVLEMLVEIAEEHREIDVQRQAIESMSHFGDSPDVRRLLERLARTHKHEDGRRAAIETLAETLPHEKSTEFFGSLVRGGGTREMKFEALEALSEMKDRAALTIIIDAANAHPDREVRRKAIQLLGDSDDPRARATLERLLTRP